MVCKVFVGILYGNFIFLLDNMEFKLKFDRRVKGGYFIFIKVLSIK